MNEFRVTRQVDHPPAPVFDVLQDIERYPTYSEFLTSVSTVESPKGDHRYELEVEWWRLSYVARTRIVDVDPPRRINWEVTSSFDAHGCWHIQGQDGNMSSQVTLCINYDLQTVPTRSVTLPFGISVDWIGERATGLLETEANRVLDRIATDLDRNEEKRRATDRDRTEEKRRATDLDRNEKR